MTSQAVVRAAHAPLQDFMKSRTTSAQENSADIFKRLQQGIRFHGLAEPMQSELLELIATAAENVGAELKAMSDEMHQQTAAHLISLECKEPRMAEDAAPIDTEVCNTPTAIGEEAAIAAAKATDESQKPSVASASGTDEGRALPVRRASIAADGCADKNGAAAASSSESSSSPRHGALSIVTYTSRFDAPAAEVRGSELPASSEGVGEGANGSGRGSGSAGGSVSVRAAAVTCGTATHIRPAATALVHETDPIELDAAMERARAQERGALRDDLLTDARLQAAASAAVRDLRGLYGATSVPSHPTETDLDGQLNGRLSPSTITPASDGVDVGERLVVERVASTMLQTKLNELGEELVVRLASEREACQLMTQQRTRAVEASCKEQLDAAARRSRMLAAQVAQQRAELVALKALNAQLLNAADPLSLNATRIIWPRQTALQPPRLLTREATQPSHSSGSSSTSPHATAVVVKSPNKKPPTPRRPQSAAATPHPPAEGSSPTALPSPRARPASAVAPSTYRRPVSARARPGAHPGTKTIQASSGLGHARVSLRHVAPLRPTLEHVVMQREKRPGATPSATSYPSYYASSPFRLDAAFGDFAPSVAAAQTPAALDPNPMTTMSHPAPPAVAPA